MSPEKDEPQEPAPEPLDVVPSYDVRNCIVCGQAMEGRKCKYVCRSCGYIIDCSDAY